MSTEAEGLEFRVLGPIEAVRDGAPVPLGGPRQQAMLALLLLQPGRPLPVDRLADELWHREPPPGAATTLRAYASRLRSALGKDARLRGTAGRYALDVPGDSIDAIRFERLIREGEQALAERAMRRAAGRLREALALWRGDPFGKLADEGMLRIEADRLTELQLHGLELRIEADQALGRASELIDELEALLAEHPYREQLWRLLMLALYRSSRQTDALAAYQRARRSLDEQLGLEPGDALQALEVAILRHEVPAIVLPEERHNLPAPLSSFVGREAELTEVLSLLSRHRLFTLTGVGGVGKTRLALEAARRLVGEYPDGTYFVDLAPLAEPGLVAKQVASALHLREQPDVSAMDQLVTGLRDWDALLVLDNCEHLREACADIALRLLQASPRLRILATSRETLGVPGEADYPVPPMTVPPPGASPEELRATESVGLLLERAREARPNLRGDDATLAAAAGICRDLDGLPLAIELAAARTRTLTLDEIAIRLRDRFQFLVSWRRLSTARHRTLRAAMEWSYDLLAPAEQVALTELSVFSGGFSLSAATAVCTTGDEDAALALIERLHGASLISADEQAAGMRYRMLETVRQFAAERLGETGERDAVRLRHARYFRAFVDDAQEPIGAGAGATWVARLAAEQDNLREALRFTRDAGTAEDHARLVVGLANFWWLHGDIIEGRRWLANALDVGVGIDIELRGLLLLWSSGLARAAGARDAARAPAEEALEIFTALGDAINESRSLHAVGQLATARGEFQAAESLLSQARERLARLGDDDPGVQTRRGELSIALGTNAFVEGDLAHAAARYREALATYQGIDDLDSVAMCQVGLGHVALVEGRYEQSAQLIGKSLRHYRSVGFIRWIIDCIELLALLAEATGDPREAARLLGAADTLRDRSGNQAVKQHADHVARQVPQILAALGEEAFQAAWAAGRAMSEAEAASRALVVVDAVGER